MGYYKITEADLNSLDSVCDQLGFINGLLNSSPGNELGSVTSKQLFAFVEAQENALKSFLSGLEDHWISGGSDSNQHAQNGPVAPVMTPEVILDFASAVNGDIDDPLRLLDIWDRLYSAEAAYPEFRSITVTYLQALERQGWAYAAGFAGTHATREFRRVEARKSTTARSRNRERLAAAGGQ